MKVLLLVTIVTLATFSWVQAEDELMQLHIIFRNGENTPFEADTYPKDPYANFQYSPFGVRQLTNEGKRQGYNIGLDFRKRYDDFLGEFRSCDYYGRSTDWDIAKTSLELVAAGLYPPKGEQVWNEEDFPNWQPIPFRAAPMNNDPILFPRRCPHQKKLFEKQDNSSMQMKLYEKYNKTFEYISQQTGLNITNFEKVYYLYFTLKAQEDWGFELPEWTKEVWPEKITEMMIKYYDETTATTDIKKMNAGFFLKKIIKDVKDRIAGTESESSGQKLNLYSSYEVNIADILIALGLFSKPHIPAHGSHIIFELYKRDNGYGIKILYHCHSDDETQLMILDGCDEICSFDKFQDLVKDVLPNDDELCRKSSE